ncbi:MAG: TRAP transporter substrate-binding protein DctP, partial [Ruegeria sp.]
DLYVPTPEQKEAFKQAATPVYEWFQTNVTRGDEVFTALTDAVAAAETEINEARAADLN